MEHIADEPILGIDAVGTIRFARQDKLRRKSCGGHPFKMEFTKHGELRRRLQADSGRVSSRAKFYSLHAGKRRGKLANAVEAVIVFVRKELVEPTAANIWRTTLLYSSSGSSSSSSEFLGMIPDVFHLRGTATGNYSITLGLAPSTADLDFRHLESGSPAFQEKPRAARRAVVAVAADVRA
jgi:hypothetical protein